MKMKIHQSLLSLLLAAVLLVQLLPLQAAAAAPHTAQVTPAADAHERVKVVVELEPRGASLLSIFRSAEKTHQKAQDAIRALCAADGHAIENSASDEVTVLFDYYHVLNGFAVEVERQYLDSIRAISGVRAAFEAQTVYPLEDEPSGTELGNADALRAVGAADADYSGAGQVIAVLDTGLYTRHEAFQGAVKNPALSQADIADRLGGTTLRDKGLTAGNVYLSQKIPFAYDYADRDLNVNPGTISDVSHGTHVAGIAAANAGETIRGVAPDAQLLIMKTFTDAGAGDDTYILAAADDAVQLGADVINMSLGSDAGFDSNRAEVYKRVYNSIRDQGVFLSAAAGNSYSATYNTNSVSDYSAAANPDAGILVDPSTYDAAISVASADCAREEYYFYSADLTKILYEEADGGARPRLAELEGTLPYVSCGYGTEDDVREALLRLGEEDLRGCIALISRGKRPDAPEDEEVLTFDQKIENARAANAAAVVVFDNVEKNTLTVMGGVSQSQIPAVFISHADGERLLQADRKTINASAAYHQGAAVRMSSFSSWGVTPEMKLKPELSAPGGNIYSAIPDNKYGYKSGTSMATPAVAGLAAAAKEYLEQDAKFSGFSEREKRDLVAALLMNTASPVPYGADSFVSPRKQGAGIGNLAALTAAKAYLTVDGQSVSRPKAELGDGTGPFTASFTVHNLTDKALTYTPDAAALSEVIHNGYFQQYSKNYAGRGVTVSFDGLTDGMVRVPAGGEAAISVTFTPEDAFRRDAAAAPNGTFLDGFVFLRAQDGSGADLSFPFLAFYGSWGAAPVVDKVLHVDGNEDADLRGCEAYSPSLYNYNLGDNNFDGEIDLNPLHYAFSKNSKGGVFSSVATITGLLRPAAEMHYVMRSRETGEIVNRYDYYNVKRSYYAPEAGMVTYAETFLGDQGGAPVFGSTAQNNRELSDGVYTVEITAKSCGPSARESGWSFDVTYDTQKPRLDGSEILGEPGEQTVVLHLSDNHYVSGVQVVYGPDDTPLETRAFDFEDYRADGRACYDVAFDYEDLNEKLSSRLGETPETVKILLYDYAMNEAAEQVVLKDVYPASVSLSHEHLSLTQGREAELQALLSPENTTRTKIVWSSSDTSVAAVDEAGLVSAVGEGCAVITAQTEAEGVFASCEIAVSPLTDAQGLILSRDALTLIMGEEAALKATTVAALQDKAVHWESGDNSIASVTADGVVSAVSTGVTTITASVTANGKTKSDTCRVTVRPRAADGFVIDENGVLLDYTGWSTQITIPDGVTAIGEGALRGKQLAEVTIPATCRSIGAEAFRDCAGLTSVRFADQSNARCSEIGARAFAGCASLSSISFPASVTTIGEGALRDSGLRTLYLPKNLTAVPDELCDGCTDLTSVELPASLQRIGARAFRGCALKNTLRLPASVEEIGDSAYEGTAITAFTAPESLRRIGDGAFRRTKLSGAQPQLNDALEQIGAEAFAETNIRTFTIPDGVRAVGDRVLADCRSLKTVSVGAGVTGMRAPTVNTPSLEAFIVSAENAALEAVDGALYTKPKNGTRTLIAWPALAIREGSVTIPADVTEIGAYAFSGMTNLSALTFAEPSTVQTIGESAFSDCSRLAAIHLPDSVESVGAEAFRNCAAARSLHLGAGLTTMGANAITGVDALAEITVDPANRAYCAENSVLYNAAKTELIRYAPKKEDAVFSAPDTLQRVDDRAFFGAAALEDVSLPEGVTAIGAEAFSGCTSLAELALPQSLESLGANAVTGVPAETLCFGTNLSRMDEQALSGAGVKHIVIEGDALSLPYLPNLGAAETLCLGDGVTAITDQLGMPSLHAVVLGENLTEVNRNAFNLLRDVTFYIPKDTASWDTMLPIIQELQRRHGSSKIRLVEAEPFVLTLREQTGTIQAALTGAVGERLYRFFSVSPDGTALLLRDWSNDRTLPAADLREGTQLLAEARDETMRTTSAQHVAGQTPAQPCDGGEACPSKVFTDVDRSAKSWYHLPVDWAVTNGVTNGTSASTFSPNQACTRGQVVTFLWRAAGEPEPKSSVNPFADVKEGEYYYKAVLWAVEQEITKGMTASQFAPNETCVRSQVVTFLWRYEHSPEVRAANPFADVPADTWYTDAVLWAVERGVTTGTSAATFAPNSPCTRAHVVTFLYRDVTAKQ